MHFVRYVFVGLGGGGDVRYIVLLEFLYGRADL